MGLLLRHGANVSVRDEVDATPLMRALEQDLPRDCVRTLLDAGADPNKAHGTLQISVLMVAASYSSAGVVSLLLESGAEVDFATPDGWTALMSAARNSSRADVILRLVAAGANINARDQYGVTPLMRAVQENPNPEVIEALVQLGANQGITTPDGHTAYDLARGSDRGREVLTLLKPASHGDDDGG
jgi:ankyrin repeat protein